MFLLFFQSLYIINSCGPWVQSTCFSVALLYQAVKEIHYAPRVCEHLAGVHVHFTVRQLVVSLKSPIQNIQVFYTEKGDFASVKTIGFSKWKFIST